MNDRTRCISDCDFAAYGAESCTCVDLRSEVERLKDEAHYRNEGLLLSDQANAAAANREMERAEKAEAERDAALALADATQTELNAERERHHATAGELNKAVTWLDRCDWARSVIDLDAGPLEVQLADALGRVERLTAALRHLLGIGHSLKAFAGTMLRWREQPGVDFSDEAARIVRLAEENHQTIKTALLKEKP